MPDITMCAGADCPRRSQCWRHTATPSDFRQAYFTTPPVKDGECREFINNARAEKLAEEWKEWP